MPEMPNVIAGNPIASAWGNQIRDRTIQRYADAAARTASHPTPTEGDLSFLNDTNKVYVFHTGAWEALSTSEETAASATLSQTLTSTSYVNVDPLSLTIPSHWGSWECVAWAVWIPSSVAQTTYAVRWNFNGTFNGEVTVLPSSSDGIYHGSHIGRRTGITATGAVTVALQGKNNFSSQQVSLLEGFVYARAVRTT